MHANSCSGTLKLYVSTEGFFLSSFFNELALSTNLIPHSLGGSFWFRCTFSLFQSLIKHSPYFKPDRALSPQALPLQWSEAFIQCIVRLNGIPVWFESIRWLWCGESQAFLQTGMQARFNECTMQKSPSTKHATVVHQCHITTQFKPRSQWGVGVSLYAKLPTRFISQSKYIIHLLNCFLSNILCINTLFAWLDVPSQQVTPCYSYYLNSWYVLYSNMCNLSILFLNLSKSWSLKSQALKKQNPKRINNTFCLSVPFLILLCQH